jgi:hypothetical protein
MDQVRLDGLVGQLVHEVGLPVVLEARRDECVEGAVQRRVGHRSDVLGDPRRDVAEALECLLAVLERAGPAGHESQERLSVALLGDERQRRSDLEGREAAQLLGRVRDQLSIVAQDVARVLELEEHRSAVHVLERVEPELERRDHAEVAATTADGPVEVRVVLLARDPEGAVAGDDVGGDEVVARETEPAGEVPDTAAQGQPADTGGRDDAAGGRQPERVRGGVEVAPGGAALGTCCQGEWVDAHAAP